MTVTVVFPYRGTGARERAFAHTYRHMQSLLPSARMVVADSGHAQFNRAASRNQGVQEAGPGVVVVCDADSLPQREPLREAIGSAHDGRLHLPYTFFLSLTEEHSNRVIDEGAKPRAGKPAFMTTYSVGGCLVMTRDAYFTAGGQDEQFNGWGGEDVAFAHACQALLGDIIRHPGHLYGLWHPSDMNQDSAQYRANIRRQQLYRRARKDPQAMRALIGG